MYNVVESSLILMYEIRKNATNLKKRYQRWSKAFWKETASLKIAIDSDEEKIVEKRKWS